jgi:hypothetical protein
MNKKSFFIAAICLLSFTATVNAQDVWERFSLQGLTGWTVPQGSKFKTNSGEKLSNGGLNVDIHVMYALPQLDNKLSVGLTWNSSFLFAADLVGLSNDGSYGLNLYGVKGEYHFLDRKVSPFGALSLGLGRLSTPKYTLMQTTTSGLPIETVIESESAFNLGIRPAIGVDFGGFAVSVAYLVPMKYKVGREKKNQGAGGVQINLGYRLSFLEW